MNRGLAIRLTLTVVGIACAVLMVFEAFGAWPPSRLPVRIEHRPDGQYVLRAATGRALPAPLVDGDSLDLEGMSPASRAALEPQANIIPGAKVRLAVIRHGNLLRVPLAFVPRSRSRAERLQDWVGGAGIAWVFLLCALLTLWRGRTAAAWGLTVVSLANLVNNGVGVIPTQPLVSFWIVQIERAMQALIYPALYVTAEALAYNGLSPRMRWWMRAALAALTAFLFGALLAHDIALTYFGTSLSPSLVDAAFDAFPFQLGISILALVMGYRRSGREATLRIRWVLASTALLLLQTVAQIATSAALHPLLYRVLEVASGFAVLAYVYAVLRTRLVDVSFVINRALVFASITALLFGVFSLLELALHQFAVGEKLFFHRQRLALGSVRIFSRECAFIEQEPRRLETAVERLAPQCSAVAVYERTPSAYRLRASRGHIWPETIDVDDPVFVSLRAQHKEVDVGKPRSSIGADALAFPMTIAEMLNGALICRPHDGEQFTSEARAALAEAARNLGMSLYILRNREQARLVADIAAGTIEESAARTRALSLVGH